MRTVRRFSLPLLVVLLAAFIRPSSLAAQGVTTGALSGFVTDSARNPVAEASILAVHVPTGTQYRAIARASGAYTLPNLRVASGIASSETRRT